MPTVASIDPRLGEPAFRRYEPLIAQALSNWPSPTSFTPPPDVALTTFTARFRDVLLGYRHNRWPASFDPALFDEVTSKSCLRSVPETNTCLWDLKSRQGRKPSLPIGTAAVLASGGSPIGPLGPYTLTPAEQHAFLLLLNNNRLPNVTVSLTHPLSIDPSPYINIGFTPHTNGVTLLY